MNNVEFIHKRSCNVSGRKREMKIIKMTFNDRRWK